MSKTHENIENTLAIVQDIQAKLQALTDAHTVTASTVAATSTTVADHDAQIQTIANGVLAIADQVTPTSTTNQGA